MTNSLPGNTLALSGDLMASFTRPPPMFTRQCERASGILHPCIGQHFVTTRVVHLPKRTETNLITESDQSIPNYQLCTARTAWCNSDQAVHSCNSWFCFSILEKSEKLSKISNFMKYMYLESFHKFVKFRIIYRQC